MKAKIIQASFFLNNTFELSFAYDFNNFIVENAPEYVQRIS